MTKGPPGSSGVGWASVVRNGFCLTPSPLVLRLSCSECVPGRLPLAQALRDELGPLLLATTVQHLEVRGVSAKVDPGGSDVQPWVAIRTCRPVPGGAVGGVHPDLAGALELRCIRVSRPLALPEVEDAGGIPALLRSLAPLAGGQGAVLLPGAAGYFQATVAVPRDAQEAHG